MMENRELVGKWGGIPLADLLDHTLDDYVLHEDILKLDSLLQPYVQCIGVEANYIVIKSGDIIIRIKPVIFGERTKPEYFIYDKVRFLNSKGHLEYGIIKDMYWHRNDQSYIYIYIGS